MEYAPRRIADVFGDPTQPAILLWHGMQADARAVVRPLAGLLARDGISVVVPDWNWRGSDRSNVLKRRRFVSRGDASSVEFAFCVDAVNAILFTRAPPLGHHHPARFRWSIDRWGTGQLTCG